MSQGKARASQKATVAVLIGGGIDSTVLIDLYRRKKHPMLAFHYDYGQKALPGEKRAIQRIVRHYRLPVRWRKLNIPVALRGDEFLGRNALFVVAAAAELGSRTLRIALGAHARSPYYDCSRRFMDSMQAVLDGYFGGRVVLEAPLMAFSKAEIVAYARRHRVPLKLTYSCTRAPSQACGECPSCLDRRALGV